MLGESGLSAKTIERVDIHSSRVPCFPGLLHLSRWDDNSLLLSVFFPLFWTYSGSATACFVQHCPVLQATHECFKLTDVQSIWGREEGN